MLAHRNQLSQERHVIANKRPGTDANGNRHGLIICMAETHRCAVILHFLPFKVERPEQSVVLDRKLFTGNKQPTVLHDLRKGFYQLTVADWLEGLGSLWGDILFELATSDDLCTTMS